MEITSRESDILNENYEKNRKKFMKLIQAQDLVREVMRSEDGESYNLLRNLDKRLSLSINHYGRQIGSVTNQL